MHLSLPLCLLPVHETYRLLILHFGHARRDASADKWWLVERRRHGAHMHFKENGAYMKLSNIYCVYTMQASIESRTGNSAWRSIYSIHFSPETAMIDAKLGATVAGVVTQNHVVIRRRSAIIGWPCLCQH